MRKPGMMLEKTVLKNDYGTAGRRNPFSLFCSVTVGLSGSLYDVPCKLFHLVFAQ